MIISREKEPCIKPNQNHNNQQPVNENREREPIQNPPNEVILQCQGPIHAMFPPNLVQELQHCVQNIQPGNENRADEIERQITNNRNICDEEHLENEQVCRYPRRNNAGGNTRITENKYDTRGMANL